MKKFFAIIVDKMKCSLSFTFLSFLFIYLVFVGFSGAQSGLAELLEAVEDR